MIVVHYQNKKTIVYLSYSKARYNNNALQVNQVDVWIVGRSTEIKKNRKMKFLETMTLK